MTGNGGEHPFGMILDVLLAPTYRYGPSADA